MMIGIQIELKNDQRAKWCAAEVQDQIRKMIGPDFHLIMKSCNVQIEEPETEEYCKATQLSSYWAST